MNPRRKSLWLLVWSLSAAVSRFFCYIPPSIYQLRSSPSATSDPDRLRPLLASNEVPRRDEAPTHRSLPYSHLQIESARGFKL
uniref:Putative secreted peptide n=1 Tax=Anopheles braziliensis TaxID=58242 RepID=A0A2M3ZWZ6_9DIPT